MLPIPKIPEERERYLEGRARGKPILRTICVFSCVMQSARQVGAKFSIHVRPVEEDALNIEYHLYALETEHVCVVIWYSSTRVSG